MLELQFKNVTFRSGKIHKRISKDVEKLNYVSNKVDNLYPTSAQYAFFIIIKCAKIDDIFDYKKKPLRLR